MYRVYYETERDRWAFRDCGNDLKAARKFAEEMRKRYKLQARVYNLITQQYV